MGPGPRPPVGEQINQKNKVPLPKNFKEVPGYLKRLFATFFRDCFIFSVWCGKHGLGSCLSWFSPLFSTVLSLY